jgi:hypothetical protein
MKLLLFSMVIYLLGVAVILYVRPHLMFRRDGSWKEFGMGGDEVSPFPIWMFCISWAVFTYAIGRYFFGETSIAAPTASTKNLNFIPTNNSTSGPATHPGYYRLDENVMRKKGVPKYIYVGEDAPSDLDD